ncbi:unnamed protein product [Caenorhabditis auriculariae]|uniref:Uncharacterized protein n=1 Tax=Caenorhabditis auriculariae TaxID=2777116 RepID=A0A8S1H8X5_9PELO|nr:unnamed protein product [Caenorhabditis auriculariae]
MAHTLPEYVNYVNSPNVSQLLSNLSVYVGLPVNLGMFWVIPDTLLSERVHFMDVLLKNVSWYSEDFYQRMQVINHHMNYFDSGIYQKPSIVNGIDVSFEILKLRVGPVMKEVYERMLAKVNCLKDPKNCDPYYQNLLYYVYSAHDETIYSMFTAFGIEDLCAPGAGEWPAFAAATLVELFLDRNNDPYFQILYRANSTTDFQAMTPLIAACGGATYCPLNVFKEAAEFYKTDMEIHAYCQVLPSQSSSTISVLIATFFSFVVFLRLL